MVFYDNYSSVCWESTGTSKVDWKVAEEGYYILDQVINEKDKVVISGIRIDEGGDEEASEVLYLGSDVTSDNVILIPTENIKFYYGSTQINPGAAIDSNTYSADASEFRIEIVPVSGGQEKPKLNLKF